MKSNKVFATITTIIVFASFCTTVSFAENQNNNTGALVYDDTVNGSELNQIAIDKIKAANANYKGHKENALEHSNIITPRYMEIERKYEISVQNFKQEKGNWCGPACMVQSLSYHKKTSGSSAALPTQKSLATRLGIANNSNGASSASIANIMNSYDDTSYGGFATYISMNITDSTIDPIDQLWNALRWTMENKTTAPIVLLETKYLDRYKGVNFRHYNTVSGVKYVENTANGDTFSWNIRTVDPHYDIRYRGEFYDRIGSQNTNGIGRAVYYADINGSNHVLIW